MLSLPFKRISIQSQFLFSVRIRRKNYSRIICHRPVSQSNSSKIRIVNRSVRFFSITYYCSPSVVIWLYSVYSWCEQRTTGLSIYWEIMPLRRLDKLKIYLAQNIWQFFFSPYVRNIPKPHHNWNEFTFPDWC